MILKPSKKARVEVNNGDRKGVHDEVAMTAESIRREFAREGEVCHKSWARTQINEENIRCKSIHALFFIQIFKINIV